MIFFDSYVIPMYIIIYISKHFYLMHIYIDFFYKQSNIFSYYIYALFFFTFFKQKTHYFLFYICILNSFENKKNRIEEFNTLKYQCHLNLKNE